MDEDGNIILRAGARLSGGAIESGVHWVDASGREHVMHVVRTGAVLLVREYDVVDGRAVKVNETYADRGVEVEERLADVLPFPGPYLPEAA